MGLPGAGRGGARRCVGPNGTRDLQYTADVLAAAISFASRQDCSIAFA